MTSPDLVRAAVGAVVDPELRRTLADLSMVETVEVDGSTARVTVLLTIEGCPKKTDIDAAVRAAALTVSGIESVDLTLGVMSDDARKALSARLHGGRSVDDRFGPNSLTRVIAVSSGKGGVGKSTVAANLAVALAARGLSVGLLDADVHGFSIPGLLGIADEKPTKVDDMILPPRAFDVGVISIGMFVDPHTPVSWRGPMMHRTVNQFLSDVHFGDLDVLVCDLPPGTGDVAISLGQLVPTADVLVVTTPQESASDIAERSGLVARQLGQRVIGVVENMSDWTDAAGTVHSMFGQGGGADVAARLDVPLLGTIPLTPSVISAGNSGVPFTTGDKSDPAVAAFATIVDAVIATAVPRGRNSIPLSV
jgi:ATP-binding protein involved in chromosome partitioning